jgi:predicted nucleic acid-binding protein
VIFFDTNLLIYSTVNLDNEKQETSDNLIESAIKENLFVVSPLVLSEFIFVVSKLKVDKILVKQALDSYKPFVKHHLEAGMVLDAYELCGKLDICTHINDAIHLKYAERYCSKIVTFDNDFKKFKDSTEIGIDILTTGAKEEPGESGKEVTGQETT